MICVGRMAENLCPRFLDSTLRISISRAAIHLAATQIWVPRVGYAVLERLARPGLTAQRSPSSSLSLDLQR